MKPRPVRIYVPDHELNTTRRKNVAWRVTCKRCGTEVKGRRVRDAIAALAGHDCQNAVATSGEDVSPANGTEL